MSVFRSSSPTFLQHVLQLRKLRDKANQIESMMSSAIGARNVNFIDYVAVVLQMLTSQTKSIRRDLLEFQLEDMDILTSESISRVEQYVGETRGAVIHLLGEQSKNSGDYDRVKVSLCFLSIALDELQDALCKEDHSFIIDRLEQRNKEKSAFKTRISGTHQCLN